MTSVMLLLQTVLELSMFAKHSYIIYFTIDFSCMLSHDSKMRCNFIDLYFALYGKKRPVCLPIPELAALLKPQRVESPVHDNDVSLQVIQFIQLNLYHICSVIFVTKFNKTMFYKNPNMLRHKFLLVFQHLCMHSIVPPRL